MIERAARARSTPTSRPARTSITFHVEATRHPHRVAPSLAGSGVVAGVALNPGTPVAAVEPLLDELDYVLLLAVDPGWSGQRFADRPSRADRGAARPRSATASCCSASTAAITRENVAASPRWAPT